MPPPSPTPLPPPSDTSTVLAEYLTSIGSRLTALRFCEFSVIKTVWDEVPCRNDFDSSLDRDVWLELAFANEVSITDYEVEFRWVAQDPLGNLFGEGPAPDWAQRVDEALQQDQRFFEHIGELQRPSNGARFIPGWYSVEVLVNGERAGIGWFQVVDNETAVGAGVDERMGSELPWLEEPLGIVERTARVAMLRLWRASPSLTGAAAELEWAYDEMRPRDALLLQLLATIA